MQSITIALFVSVFCSLIALGTALFVVFSQKKGGQK
jgi:ABC-type spermidine/putrescine transport system permease subunit I